MCWKSVTGKDAAWRKADEDIPVFKVVRAAEGDGGASPDRGTPFYYGAIGMRESPEGERRYVYEKGGTYYPDYFHHYDAVPGKAINMWDADTPEIMRSARVEYGIHSYSRGCGVTGRTDGDRVRILSEVDPEYMLDYYDYYECVGTEVFQHDRMTGKGISRYAEKAFTALMMRCVIPAGTVYAKNAHGEYVSCAIRVEGFEPLWENTGENGEG